MKHWGKLTTQPGSEYQQVSAGDSGKGTPSGKFLPGGRSKEFDQKSLGASGKGTPSGKFLGKTKGNSDNSPEKTSGVSANGGGKRHVAGGKSSY